jgi:hypothetical protein
MEGYFCVESPDYRAALTGDIKGVRIGIVRHLYEEDLAVTPEVRSKRPMPYLAGGNYMRIFRAVVG